MVPSPKCKIFNRDTTEKGKRRKKDQVARRTELQLSQACGELRGKHYLSQCPESGRVARPVNPVSAPECSSLGRMCAGARLKKLKVCSC